MIRILIVILILAISSCGSLNIGWPFSNTTMRKFCKNEDKSKWCDCWYLENEIWKKAPECAK